MQNNVYHVNRECTKNENQVAWDRARMDVGLNTSRQIQRTTHIGLIKILVTAWYVPSCPRP